ncbi:MAG TPA: hypothetical protein VGM44_14345 [Polyangiaceae bacterium]|jgi:hypothetical protein
MDLWVRPVAENGERVLTALAECGVTAAGLSVEQFENPRTLVVLGREPFQIDILTDLPGLSFDEAWGNRGQVTLDGVTIPLIGKRDLIKNKRAVGRLQDLADADELERIE